jgi:hypothetical protein
MNDPLNENKEMIINNNENIDIITGNLTKKIYTESIMKRKLLHEIIIDNIKQSQFNQGKNISK